MQALPTLPTKRKRLAKLLDVGVAGDLVSRIVDVFLIGLISLNVMAIVLESVPSLALQYAAQFHWFEIVSVALFTFEYGLRVWSAPDLADQRFRRSIWGRVRYVLTPAALIDLLAILPFYLGIFLNLDMRFLRVVRLFRIFKLTRYSTTMGLILNVFRDEAASFVGAFFLLFVLLILTASGIYLIEHDVQPKNFGSIPAAMWWAMATLTTVGYGDVTPFTPWGKLFGGFITVIGIGMVALPAGILASGFSEQLRQRREKYSDQLDTAIEDGVVSVEEESDLERLRRELGIDSQDAAVLRKSSLRRVPHNILECPHCHRMIDKPAPAMPSSGPDVRPH